MRQHADPRRADLREFGARHQCDDAGPRLGGARIDRDDAGMRVGRAQIDDMHHARQREVADVIAAALQQAAEIGTRHGAADVGIRPVERGESAAVAWRVVRHGRARRAAAVASTASTIA